MSLRNNKELNKNFIKKNRVINNRSSKDVYKFSPVSFFIYHQLPTNECVLNFYFFFKEKKQLKSSIVHTIAKKLHKIWSEFIRENNLKIVLLSESSIGKEMEKLISEWQNIQKNISRENHAKEHTFVSRLHKIINCAKGADKCYFEADEEIEIDRIPKGNFPSKKNPFPCF